MAGKVVEEGKCFQGSSRFLQIPSYVWFHSYLTKRGLSRTAREMPGVCSWYRLPVSGWGSRSRRVRKRLAWPEHPCAAAAAGGPGGQALQWLVKLQRAACAPQIFNLMKFDSYTRFLKSQLYQECILAEVEGRSLPDAQQVPSIPAHLRRSLVSPS